MWMALSYHWLPQQLTCESHISPLCRVSFTLHAVQMESSCKLLHFLSLLFFLFVKIAVYDNVHIICCHFGQHFYLRQQQWPLNNCWNLVAFLQQKRSDDLSGWALHLKMFQLKWAPGGLVGKTSMINHNIPETLCPFFLTSAFCWTLPDAHD